MGHSICSSGSMIEQCGFSGIARRGFRLLSQLPGGNVAVQLQCKLLRWSQVRSDCGVDQQFPDLLAALAGTGLADLRIQFAKPVKPATKYPRRTYLRTPEGGQSSTRALLQRVPHSGACKLLVHIALNKVSCRIRTTGCVELELLPHCSSRERAFRRLQHEINFQRVRVRAAAAAWPAVPRGVPRSGLGSLRCLVYPGAQPVAAREPGKAGPNGGESSRDPLQCFCDLVETQSPRDGAQNCQSTLIPTSRGGPKIAQPDENFVRRSAAMRLNRPSQSPLFCCL
jgi:hypothetical protein